MPNTPHNIISSFNRFTVTGFGRDAGCWDYTFKFCFFLFWLSLSSGPTCTSGNPIFANCFLKIGCDLPNFQANILPDDIHRAKQFHAYPCHSLLTCSDDDNQWFWCDHLIHVSHAGSDFIGCDLPNFFRANTLPDDIYRANQFHVHTWSSMPSSFYICSDDDNQWFWVDHLRPMWVMLGQICGQGSTKIGCDLPNFRANILLYDILRANQFHAHIHAIIFWHAQMMISIVIGCDLPNFRAIILPDDIHRANKFHADHL
jgi:hypothetical protein